MSTKQNKKSETTMDDVLEMISSFEKGNFSKTLSNSLDPNLQPLVDKLNSAAKILAAQAAHDASFIIDSLGIGIWKWDLVSNSLEWDKNMYRLYGCDPKDFNGAYDAWENSLSAETKAKAVEEINIAVAGGKSFDTTFQVVQRNTGKIQEIRTRAFVIRDSAGKPLKMWGIDVDRTREAELENEIKETAELLKQTEAMAKVGSWELDVKTGKTRWTEQTYRIHAMKPGTPTDKVMGINFYAPHERERITQCVMESFKGQSYREIFEFIDANEQHKWVEAMGKPIKNAKGEVYKVIGTFRDVSEELKKLRASKDLANENHKYRLWIENANEGVWQIDLQGQTIFANNGMAKILGYEAKEMIGRSFFSFMFAEDHAAAQEKLSQRQAGASEIHEWRMQHKQGDEIFLIISAQTQLSTAGEPLSVVAMCSDITQLKKRKKEVEEAQEAIFLANERMSAILDHAPIVSYECLLDRDWTMNYISSYIKEVSGYPAEDFTQKIRSFNSIVHPEDRALVGQKIQRAINGNKIYDLKYRIIHANGELRHLHEKGRLSLRTGNLVGVILDVSEQEKLSRDFRNIFDYSKDMLCIANFDGYFLRVSPSFSHTLGYSEAELLSRPYAEFVVENDVDKTSKESKNLSLGNETLDFENRYRCKNGHIKIMSWSARPDPKTGLIYASVRDVTGQRNIEHKNQQILDSLNFLSIVSEADVNGKITFANDHFSTLSGYSNKELIGKDHRMINSGKHSKSFFKDMWNTISAGSLWSGQIENRTKDGSPYFVNTVIAPIKDVVTDKIISYYSLRQDVSKAVLSQKRLEEAEQAGGLGSFILNLNNKKAYWSKGHSAIFGISDDVDPTFDLILEKIHPEDRNILTSSLQEILQQGKEEFSIRYRVILSDSSLRYIESFGRVQKDSSGIAAEVTGIVLDVTRKVQSEALLESQRLQIIQSSKLASLGEMAAGIAHEINNPLAVIVGSVPLVTKFRNDDAKFNTKLETIAKSAERIEKIVKGLKKFSRTGDGSIHKSESIASIVSESLILCEAKSKRHSTRIEAHIDPELRITCDGVEIEQVLVNLINNGIDAVKANDERWIKINAFADGAQAVLQVIDSGQGIASDIAKKLFHPFFTTKAVGEGTGLGLSIAKGILDAHKASFVLNRSFQNTCFEIRFAKADPSEVKNAA
jgi:PAS domain S-box-containing protein